MRGGGALAEGTDGVETLGTCTGGGAETGTGGKAGLGSDTGGVASDGVETVGVGCARTE